MIHKWIFTESLCKDEVLLVVVGEEVSCQVLSWGIWYILQEHRLDCLLGLMLGTKLALINIISDVHVYSGPVDSGFGQESHLFYSSVVVVDSTEHGLIHLRG